MITFKNAALLGEGRYIYSLSVYTSGEWNSQNPVVPLGVLAYASDTHEFKVGDGETTWRDLRLGSAGDGIEDAPNDNNTYIRHFGGWTYYELVHTKYPGLVLNITESPILLKTEWKMQSINPKGSMVVYRRADRNPYYYCYFNHNLSYIPTAECAIASSYNSDLENENYHSFYKTYDGLNYTPIEVPVKYHQSSSMYIPERDMFVAYNAGNNGLFDYTSEYSKNYIQLYNIDTTSENILDNQRLVYLVDENLDPPCNVISNINGKLYITTNNINGKNLYTYDLVTDEVETACTSSNSGEIWYCEATNQYITTALEKTSYMYYNNDIQSDQNIWCAVSNELAPFYSISTKFIQNIRYITQAHDIFYEYVYNSTLKLPCIIAFQNAYNFATQPLATIVLPMSMMDLDSSGKPIVYQFKYLPLANLFYLMTDNNVYFSKNLITWYYKPFPSGFYPGMVKEYNEVIKSTIKQQHGWVNLDYMSSIKSVIGISNLFSFKIDVSSIVG